MNNIYAKAASDIKLLGVFAMLHISAPYENSFVPVRASHLNRNSKIEQHVAMKYSYDLTMVLI
jgi:hypothetical protein